MQAPGSTCALRDHTGQRIKSYGYLERKTTILGRWRRVFAVLIKDSLAIYKDELRWREGKTPKIRIKLYGSSVEEDVQFGSCGFSIMSFSCFTENLRCEDKTSREKWVNAIKTAVKKTYKHPDYLSNRLSPKSKS
jgi:hypothetical protein